MNHIFKRLWWAVFGRPYRVGRKYPYDDGFYYIWVPSFAKEEPMITLQKPMCCCKEYAHKWALENLNYMGWIKK